VEFGVWVSTRYLSYRDREEKKEPAKKTVKPRKEKSIKEDKGKKTVIDSEDKIPAEKITEEIKPLPPQIKPAVSVPAIEENGLELVSYAGYLDDMGMIVNRPGTYKLTADDQWICILTSPLIELNPYVTHQVRIEGIIVSQTTSWGVPVVEVKRLQVIK